MTDEQKRIKSYLEAQGAKLPPAAIVDKVRAAMADLGKAALAVPPEEIVDTNGAGDVFHGAYAAGLARGVPLVERLRLARSPRNGRPTR